MDVFTAADSQTQVEINVLQGERHMVIITGGVGCILVIAIIAWRWKSLRMYGGAEPVSA